MQRFALHDVDDAAGFVAAIVTRSGLALTLLVISLLTVTACGGGGSSKASQVCRQIHENPKLFVALVQHRPLASIPNPTPATVFTRQLGEPDERITTRNAGIVWWRYANTAYLVSEAMQSTPAHDYVLAKACNWKFTQKRVERFGG